jgi:hypothetical protein
MISNDAKSFAQRLYSRVPDHYRVFDAERGQPLLALLRVIGAQAANLRQDLDDLWDDFFIETCDDWAVPYLGALTGTKLLAQDIGQSNRLDVWNTVIWRRSKGTPAMLRALAQAITEWPADFAEFFQTLGWSQNMNHRRIDHPLHPDLRDQYALSLLGRAADPVAHAAEFKPSRPLDQTRVMRHSLGIGIAGWGTPGRYQIKNLGFFVRRMQTFPVKGATPAAAPPGAPVPSGAACFTFDPLFRNIPLFVEQSREPLTRAAFDHAPGETFGTDVAIRQFGVLIADPGDPQPVLTSSRIPFDFGGAGAGLALEATSGLRLLDARAFQGGGTHFVIAAEWRSGPTSTTLGELSTLRAAHGGANAYTPGSPIRGAGQLAITIRTCGGGLFLPPSAAGRFPSAVIAVRLGRAGAVHAGDGLYVYLPPRFITPPAPFTCFISDDGSSYTLPSLDITSLARESEGQIYPPRESAPDTTPVDGFLTLNRVSNGLRIADPSRFGGAGALIQAELFSGAYQPLGAVATIDQLGANYPQLQAPAAWNAFTYVPSTAAVTGNLPDTGLLTFFLKPLTGNFIPAAEVVVINRRGESLLVYLPEIGSVPPTGRRVFVASEGSTFFVPDDLQKTILTLRGLTLARAASGQALPIPGIWPFERRRPVSINLCRCERAALLGPGELGIDPELGRFALAGGDPAIGHGGLTVDYVEAFSERVGALSFDRQIDPAALPSSIVSQSGDPDLTSARPNASVHATVADAVAAAQDGDIIEIADSLTYAVAAPVTIGNAAVHNLTIRAAAGCRPCLTFYVGPNAPASASFMIATPLSKLDLSGLLVSGGPVVIQNELLKLHLEACTLDPRVSASGSLIATDSDLNHQADYLICRSITGGIVLEEGVKRVTVADSIVDQRGGFAISGLAGAGSPPSSPPLFFSPPASPPSSPPSLLSQATAFVQLERVTVLGQIHCDVLSASECVFDDLAFVEDRQSGCIRFTRFESGSVLPRRFQCVPSEAQAASCRPPGRCFAPLFNSRVYGRPDYAQLAAACPPEILTASERHSEIGAFTSALNPIRLSNLQIKLQEFMPVGLSAVVIAET